MVRGGEAFFWGAGFPHVQDVGWLGGGLSLGAIGIANATLPGFMQEKEKEHKANDNLKRRLEQLKEAYQAGLLTEDEFNA